MNAEVWLATRTDAPRQAVAIKIYGKHAGSFRDLPREEQALEIMRSPGVVSLLDRGDAADGRQFIVMERIDASLKDLLNEGTMAVATRFSLALQMLQAVRTVHAHGFIHGDLKPSNIGVRGNQLCLMDFGTSALRSGGNVDLVAIAVWARTSRGAPIFSVTPSYGAPELQLGERPGTATDVYSLGCVFFELFSESPVVTSAEIQECFDFHASDTPNWELLEAAGIPRTAVDAIRAMLAKDPRGRPTIAELTAVFYALRQSLTPKSDRFSPTVDRRAAREFKRSAKLASARIQALADGRAIRSAFAIETAEARIDAWMADLMAPEPRLPAPKFSRGPMP